MILRFDMVRGFFTFVLMGQLVGCMDHQTGKFEVSRHAMVRAKPDYSEIDLFFGRKTSGSSPDDEELLLSLVFWDGGAGSTRSARSFLSRGSATTCRVEFNGNGTVVYGSFWDRENDVLTIGSKEFRRSNGNVLLILGPNSPEPTYVQVPINVKSQVELIEALTAFTKSRTDLPLFRLDNTSSDTFQRQLKTDQ